MAWKNIANDEIPVNMEAETTGEALKIRVGRLLIYVEANCPTKDDRVEELIDIYEVGEEEESIITLYGKEVQNKTGGK